VENLGGTLVIETELGGGTALSASVPIGTGEGVE
jgi:signal transduction histidine kinase